MADPNSPLAALALRARNGDRKAFEQIVRGTARLVYARIVATVRDRQKAEDLTQETYVAAWKGIGTWEGIGDATVRERSASNTPAVCDGAGRNARPTTGQVAETYAASFVAWLLTVARHTTLDALKADTRQKRGGGQTAASLAGVQGAAAEEAGPAESAQRAETVSHALSVLEELPEEYRRVLSMRYLGGADYETIRHALDLTDGALRGLLSRGMALMRERMGRTATDRVT